MFAQNFLIELHHLETFQHKSLGQQTIENNTGQITLHAIRLKQNQCPFLVFLHLTNQVALFFYPSRGLVSRKNHAVMKAGVMFLRKNFWEVIVRTISNF